MTTPANVVIARGIGDNCASFFLGGDIYLAKEDGTGVVVALANSTDYEEFKVATPGGWVIYKRVGVNCVQSDLYSVNADGIGTVILANSTDIERFAGITSGGRVIYQRVVGGTQFDLYSVNADGTDTAVLNETGNTLPSGVDYPIAITPNGRVIYWRIVGGQFDLYSVNADGTGMLVLANSSDDEYIRTSSNNGTAVNPITTGGRVIYERYIGGNNYDVHSVNTDGTGTVGLANSVDREEFNGFF